MNVRAIVLAILLAAPSALFFAPTATAAPATYDVSAIPFRPLALDGAAQSLVLPTGSTSGGIGIGFQTTFFGRAADTFWVSRHGFITLQSADSDGCCQGGSIPGSTRPSQFLAGFWTNLDPDAGGSVRFERVSAPADTNASQALVVAFENVPTANDHNVTESFQMIVLDDGAYEVHWANVTTAGVNATIGMEDSDSSNGVLVARSANLARHEEAIRFTPVAAQVSSPTVSSVSPSVAPAGSTIQVNGSGFQAGARVTLNSSSANLDTFTNFASDAILTFPTPTTLAPGTYALQVRNPDGGASPVMVDALTITFPDLRIDSLNPDFGQPGDRIVVNGAGFDTDVSVQIQGVSAPTSRTSSAQLLVTVPDVPPTSSATLAVASRGNVTSAPFRVIGLVNVTQVAPSHGLPGDAVRATVTGLQPGFGASLQRFGQSTPLNVTEADEFGFGFVIPSIPGGGATLVVTNPDSGRATAPFFVDFQPSGGSFAASSVTPSHAPPGARVLISGSGFVGGARVSIGGLAAPATMRSDAAIEATVPKLTPGGAAVVVTNGDGATASVPGGLVVDAPTLRIDVVTPASARAGNLVRVEGAGLANEPLEVVVGGEHAFVTSQSDRAIVFAVPLVAAGPRDVVVRGNLSGAATLPDALDVLVGPALESVSPSTARPQDLLTLTGSGFDEHSVVSLDGRVLPTTFASPTRLFADVGATRSGIHDLSVTSDGATATLSRGLAVLPAPDLAVSDVEVRGLVAIGGVEAPREASARIVTTIQNRGDASSSSGFLAISVRPAGSSDPGERIGSVGIPSLAPGQSTMLVVSWPSAGYVGDFEALARITLFQRQVSNSNDDGSTSFSLGISGVPGQSPNQCVGCVGNVPAPTESDHIVQSFVHENDHFEGARVAIQLNASGAQFDAFNARGVSVFTDTGSRGEPVPCTVFSFDGTGGALLAAGRDDAGGMMTVSASRVSGDRSELTHSFDQYWAAGVLMEQSNFSTSQRVSSVARPVFPVSPNASLTVSASGLRGTITRCVTSGEHGQTFLIGSLNATALEVSHSESTFAVARRVGVFAPPGTLAPEAAGDAVYALHPGATLHAEARYADGVGSTRFAFLQFTGATGGPGQRLQPTPECTEWIGTFDEAAMRALASDGASDVKLTLDGAIIALPQAPLGFAGTPLDMEIAGAVGGLTGTILVCDQAGNGLVRMTLQATDPAALRVTFGGEI